MRLILSILMIGASIAGFALFVFPQYGEVSALRAQAADFNQVLTNARTLQEQRNRLVEKYNSIDTTLRTKLDRMLPRNPENVKLILELDNIAKQYGMSLQNVKIEDTAAEAQAVTRPGTQAANAELGTLRITFGLTGPYSGFTSFVSTMEKSLRIVDVEKVAFTALDERQNYQYTVTVKSYWLK